VRICLIYDCLFPYTVGGAERWYRALGERLAEDGHEVTYLTLRQWDRGTVPDVPGVAVRAVGPRMALYAGPGRRRVLPPLVFGAGVAWHLLRHGRRYDVIHTCSFPYFSLLAAALVRPLGRYRVIVDWFELWSRSYWREYLGRIGGRLGWLTQRLCTRVPQHAFCFSRLYAERLRELGVEDVELLAGVYTGPLEVTPREEPGKVVLFAGRQIPEKQVPAIIPAIALARRELPHLRASLVGDGPDRDEVLRLVADYGLQDVVDVPGFIAAEEVDRLMRQALCVLLPSRREGYGLVVVEAAAHGTPSVVVSGPDNAAAELIADGENGFVAASADPAELAAAVVRVDRAGRALRRSTADWFAERGPSLSLARSLQIALAAYGPAEPLASARS
jgi:glycosyltransferase involved in cell wall biosynthesis